MLKGNPIFKSQQGLIAVPKGLYEEKTVTSPAMIVDADPAKKSWTAYAAVFGNKDLDDDVSMPGMFKKTIAENGPNGNNSILVLNQHLTWQVLTKPTVLTEDSKGLYYEATITSGATFAEDAVKLLAAGLVEENSFGFQTVKSTIQQPDAQDWETWYRELIEVALYEVSPVTWGANPKARLQGMKGKTLDELQTQERKLLKALREPGMRDETYQQLEIQIKQINTEYYNLGKQAVSLEEKGAAMLTCPNCKAAFNDPDGDGYNDINQNPLTGDVECPECKCMFTKSTRLVLSRKSLLSGVAGIELNKSIYNFNF